MGTKNVHRRYQDVLWALFSGHYYPEHSCRSCNHQLLLTQLGTLEHWPHHTKLPFALPLILTIITYLHYVLIPIEVALSKIYDVLFKQKCLDPFLYLPCARRATRKWLELGCYVASGNYSTPLPWMPIEADDIRQDGDFDNWSSHVRSCPRKSASKTITDAYRRKRLSIKYAGFCILLWLPCVTSAAISTDSANYTLECGIRSASTSQGGNDSWVWFLWPAIVIGILFWELATVRILGQPLLFHGVSMGLFGAGYLLMVLDSRVPFYIQFSTWLGCATLTGLWTYHDTHNLSAEGKRITGLALVVLPLLLDLSILNAFALGSDTTINNTQSAPSLFVAFLLPCVSLSAFVWSSFRIIYEQIIQRNTQVAAKLQV